jgi:AcrR family transcriptional regulator
MRSKQLYIRRAIEASFLKLLDERPFEKITVKNIVDDCGLTRNTFYNYFEDTYDVVDGLLRALVCDVLDSDERPDTLVGTMSPVMQFAREHPRAIAHLYRSSKREELMLCFDKMFELMAARLCASSVRAGRLDAEDEALMVQGCRFLLSGFFEQGSAKGMEESLEETRERMEMIFKIEHGDKEGEA